MARLPVGLRIRQHRRQRGVTQAALASRVGISASYLNLIEHGKREVAGSLLRRLAGALDLELEEVAGADAARLVQDLTEVTTEPLLRDLALDQAGINDLVGRRPEWGRAAVRLHRSYRRAATLAEALSDRLAHDSALIEASHELRTRIAAVRAFAEILHDHAEIEPERRARFVALMAGESGRLGDIAEALFHRLSERGETGRANTPAEDVDDFIIDHDNHFPDLEEQAEAIAAGLAAGPDGDGTAEAALARWLAERHGVRVAIGDPGPIAGPPARRGRYDAETRVFHAARGLAQPTLRFALARLAFALAAAPVVAAHADDSRLRSEAARRRAVDALNSYGAGAVLFPYGPFRAAAEEARYDVDRLAGHFAASVEQICHRLVTLRRPGEEGVPFAFLRVDPAGNISKRFSLPVLRLPRFGGACPLWAVYTPPRNPAATAVQRVRLAEGPEFLFIARTIAKPPVGYGLPGETYGLMIGCETIHASRTVYGDAPAGPAVETGINCHLCPREDCPQRAFPSTLGSP
ncbi:helix-turn-helix domain-containing protein [Azospirillum sp. ST 5-10]|uniref:helix-turn-helix domain-containing protein n=1 Tax=unclassified Azospirillum TaxID=2630922 RepID=UPI003F4A5735